MIAGIWASLAGLFAFEKRLGYTANNIANSNSDGYKKVNPVITEDANGLPRVEPSVVDTPGFIIHEGDGSFRELSNVDLSGEIPQLIISQRGYEANLKALETESELLKSILDIDV